MGEKHRPGARPKRAGSAPPNNTPRGGGDRNKPNTGGNRGGNTSNRKATQHKSGGQAKKGCGGKRSIVTMPFLILAVLFYALPRLAFDTWRERRR